MESGMAAICTHLGIPGSREVTPFRVQRSIGRQVLEAPPGRPLRRVAPFPGVVRVTGGQTRNQVQACRGALPAQLGFAQLTLE